MTERELFLQALEINDPAQRAAFLVLACKDQPDKRVLVEQLLKAHDQAGAFLAQPLGHHDTSTSTVVLSRI
jgi:hypothetical protein